MSVYVSEWVSQSLCQSVSQSGNKYNNYPVIEISSKWGSVCVSVSVIEWVSNLVSNLVSEWEGEDGSMLVSEWVNYWGREFVPYWVREFFVYPVCLSHLDKWTMDIDNKTSDKYSYVVSRLLSKHIMNLSE